MLIPNFYITENAAIRLLYECNGKRLFFLEGLARNFTYLPTFRPEDFLYVQLSWHTPKSSFDNEFEICAQFNIDPLKVVWLCNTLQELVHARACGFSALFCNHNCWLDEALFPLRSHAERIYDIVLVTRPEGWKRPFLASKCTNLAIVKGYNFRKNDYFELESLNPAFINDERLTPAEVSSILSSSYTGGCFSSEEGACYSSSEMLLSGLPVVSTRSLGGRDVWYDNHNSIIVDPEPDAVMAAVVALKDRYSRQPDFSASIRSRHISLSYEHRNRFILHVAETLGVDICESLRLFKEYIFKHKMVEYHHSSRLPSWMRQMDPGLVGPSGIGPA